MPPRKRETTTTEPPAAKEFVADEGKTPDEAQAETPPADQMPAKAELAAASLAGLAGDLKALHEGHNIALERLDAAESSWASLTESINRTTVYMDDRVSRLENAVPAPPVPAIFAAMWGVMNNVQGIGKHGRMEYGERYQYRKYDDLKRELGAACRTHGVMLQSEILGVANGWPFKDERKTRVQIQMRYRFTSLVDGSSVAFESVGESIDTSDKATGKAMTMALKTTLDQAFMLAAEDIEDPDATRPGEDDVPREVRQERRDQTVQRRAEPPAEPSPAEHRAAAERAERAAANRAAPPEYAVGDTVSVAGQTFVKHSDGPGFPSDRPKDDGNPWDQGPPKDNRTDEQKAQAAADKVSAPGITMTAWTTISDAARQMGLYDVLVKVNGQEMALKHHLVAVGRTLG